MWLALSFAACYNLEKFYSEDFREKLIVGSIGAATARGLVMELKLLLIYNIKPNREGEYYRYVLGEFLPTLQSKGLMMVEGWHTAYGDYPMRLIAFRPEDGVDLYDIMDSREWQEARRKLLLLVRDYEERVVLAKNMFQFFIPSQR